MKKILFAIICSVCLCAFSQVSSAATVTKTLTVSKTDLLNATAFSLSFSLGGAQVNFTRSDSEDTIVEAVVTYDDARPAPALTTSSSGGSFTAKFTSAIESDNDQVPEIEKWEITIGSFDIDTDLGINGGGLAGSMELGGLPLRKCNFNLGGVSMDINFSTPTTRQVEKLSIQSGGIILTMSNIGNTDFGEFQLLGGGYTGTLDFQGTLTSLQHKATILAAGSTLKLSVPPDAGEKFKIISVGALVSLPGSGWNKKGLFFVKEYTTDDYASRNIKLDFDLLAAGALVTIARQ